MKLTNCILSDDSMTTIIGGTPYTVGKDHPKWSALRDAVKEKDGDKFLSLYSNTSTVKSDDNFKLSYSLVIGYNSVTYNGYELENVAVDRLLQFQNDGVDTTPLKLFLEKLMENPSKACVDALYSFLERKGLPICEDGDVLGWKVVRSNFKDKHTGRVDNTPGAKIPPIPRNMVDDNCNAACSLGYHIGDLDYAGPNGHFKSPGERTLLCKFNPKDVVSIPSDSSQGKIRVTVYEVLSEYNGQEIDHTYTTVDKYIEPKIEKPTKPAKPAKLEIKDLKHGDKIGFTWMGGYVVMKFEGINKRRPDIFYGRLLKGTRVGEPGRSDRYLINEARDLKRL